MASLKEVKTRINSVKSTRKITSAMKMVASAKLHKAQGAIENMLPYQKKLNKILTNFLSADLPIESPYVQEREVKRVAIVVFSSNTSLCGAFNANVIKMMMQTIGEFRTLGQDNILIFPVGKKVDEAAKRMGFKPQEVSPTLSDKPTYQVILGGGAAGLAAASEFAAGALPPHAARDITIETAARNAMVFFMFTYLLNFIY